MTHDEIRAAVAADPLLVQMVPNWQGIAESLPPFVTVRETFVTERGIVNALGVIAGESFLQALERFAADALPNEHPLKAYQPGIARQIGWLKREGLDAGSPAVRMLLDTMSQIGLVTSEAAQAIKALAESSESVTAHEVEVALKNADGSMAI